MSSSQKTRWGQNIGPAVAPFPSQAQRPGQIKLTGKTVTLEPLTASHAVDLWPEVKGNDHIWTYLGDEPYQSFEDFQQAVTTKAESKDLNFMAIIVGNILFSPRLQRSKAATEAMYLMMKHVFDDLGYRRYEWKCDRHNGPSKQAALRLGFTFEGVFRQHMVYKGRSRDTAWFSVIDKDWPLLKKAFEKWLEDENFDAEGGVQLRRLQDLREELPAQGGPVVLEL
ncbi:hypothetical protein DV738_g107, partial [Chaetothyriales sp. CBS 135597]